MSAPSLQERITAALPAATPDWIPPAGGYSPPGSGLVTHPVYGLPTRGQWEAGKASEENRQGLLKYLQQRAELIAAEQDDLWKNCWLPATWTDADALLPLTPFLYVAGGNRPGKTTWAMRKAIEVLGSKPAHGKRPQVLVLHESEGASIRLHHMRMWEHFPREWKGRRKTALTNVKWEVKNGFSGNAFTIDGAVCTFGNYNQAIDPYEGQEYDLIVFDEKAPLDWVQRLLRGIATRAGKIIWAYTAIEGVTPAVNEVLTGARTLISQPIRDPAILDPAERHVEDCPVGHMPYIQQSAKFDGLIIYFPSHSNPFGGYDELKRLYGRESKDVRERRFYGYARKLIKACFPKFGAVNILPELPPGEYTRYHIIDPAGTRNMFQLWVAIDANGYHYVYDEWPDHETFGAWAVASADERKWDGAPGPAQAEVGLGVSDYKQVILTREGNEFHDGQWRMNGDVIFERFIDPRSGKQETVAENTGGLSLIDRFGEDQVDYNGNTVGPALDFIPAPGLLENEGLSAINNLLAYDVEQPLVHLLNEPRLYVTKNCQSLIWALQNYTKHDGEKAACKDPVDCLRYAVTAELVHLAEDHQPATGGGTY